jgi:hypothetical protein
MKRSFLLYRTTLSIIGLAGCISMAGCISLKPITELTGKSVKSLAIYEEIPTTYAGFCEERCQFNLIRRNQLVRDTAVNCNCSLFVSADKATTKVYNALTAYFKALNEISEGKLTSYNTKALGDALVEGKFASLTIDKNTVNAYSSLGRLVMQVFTDGYRKKKIHKVIETGNPSIQTLFNVFQTSVANLILELDFQKERNYALYTELLMEKQSGYDKVNLGKDYYYQVNALNTKQAQLQTFSKSLVTIAKGHQKLYDNRNKITTKEISEMAADYSAALQDLIVDFKKM